MAFYLNQSSFSHLIQVAALCLAPNRQRHPHQRRIPARALSEARQNLASASGELRKAKSFSELHAIVERHILPIKGIGPLAVYDISHRIGAYLRCAPDVIFLHAGTREGAKLFNLRGATIELSMLPSEFHVLSPAEAEDCLCIYRDELSALKQNERLPRSCDHPQMPRSRCGTRGRPRCSAG
jgi:hypothetical protein